MLPVSALPVGLTRLALLCCALLLVAACDEEEPSGAPARPSGTAKPQRTPVPTIVEPFPVAVAMVVRGTVLGIDVAGGELLAFVGGMVCGRTTPSPAGRFEVSVHEESQGGFRGCTLGSKVEFELRGYTASEFALLERRGKRALELDLTFGGR